MIIDKLFLPSLYSPSFVFSFSFIFHIFKTTLFIFGDWKSIIGPSIQRITPLVHAELLTFFVEIGTFSSFWGEGISQRGGKEYLSAFIVAYILIIYLI